MEGNSKFGDESCNWGGNLIGAKQQWIDPTKIPTDRLVYAATSYGPDLYSHKFPKDPKEDHTKGDDYGPFHNFDETDPKFPQNLVKDWDYRFGFLQKDGIGPVNIKEWGGQMGFRIQNQKELRKTNYDKLSQQDKAKVSNDYDDPAKKKKEEEKDALWTEEFVRCMKANDMDYFYWVLCNSLTDDVGALIGPNGMTKAVSWPKYPDLAETIVIDKIDMIKKANPPI